MSRNRDFDPRSLLQAASLRLQVNWGARHFFENRVWQFIVFLPRWLLIRDTREQICTANDQDQLQLLLEYHFGGYTVSTAPSHGVGRRGIYTETNVHAEIRVLASRWRGTKRYFKALRNELEVSSGEEQILILRQDFVIV